MKQTIISTITWILLITACFGIYYFWNESKIYEKLYNDRGSEIEKYNEERVKYIKELNEVYKKLKPLDNKLKIHKKGLIGITVAKTSKQITNGGKGVGVGEIIPESITEAVRSEYTFSDYHLQITFYTLPGEFRYLLDQRFEIRHFDIGEKIQIEMAELDKEGNVRQTYNLSIDSYKAKQKNKFHTGFSLSVGGGGFLTTQFKGTYSIHAIMNFLSHGTNHLDSNFRFLSIGAGYPGLVIAPIQYRISNRLPMFSDIFIEPIFLLDYKLKPLFGIGLSSTL